MRTPMTLRQFVNGVSGSSASGSSVSRSSGGRFLRPALAAVVVVALSGLSACSSSELNSMEALQYKRELVMAHRGRLTEAQVQEFLYDPGRTRQALDERFASLRADFDREVQVEAERLAEERKGLLESRKKSALEKVRERENRRRGNTSTTTISDGEDVEDGESEPSDGS